MRLMDAGHHLVLLDLRSAHNVGALFRSADGAGFTKLWLVGYTPTPIDRFGRPQPAITKTALGAETTVAWEAVPDWGTVADRLATLGRPIVAVEQAPRALSYREYVPKQPTAFVVGNEVTGVPQSVLDQAAAILEIPLVGSKESLNVAVAGSIIMFAMASGQTPAPVPSSHLPS
jgi:tRNA G18 (ribose-2'-O)-methylase SpoU